MLVNTAVLRLHSLLHSCTVALSRGGTVLHLLRDRHTHSVDFARESHRDGTFVLSLRKLVRVPAEQHCPYELNKRTLQRRSKLFCPPLYTGEGSIQLRSSLEMASHRLSETYRSKREAGNVSHSNKQKASKAPTTGNLQAASPDESAVRNGLISHQ